ncbi:MAG: RNA methyltransferase [Weeksellaceae bacterium]|nr:RNA methyltransferase [Weeksellaceae bacterium]
MLTNKDAKLINSLLKKKYRQKYNKFVVEGIKNVTEVLESSVKVHRIFSTENLFPDYESITEIISLNELKKISQQITPNMVLALCELPDEKKIQSDKLILVLDDVRDPGNLGTIIRTADWFGIRQIVCSKETVDVFNPKVIQSSMASFTRVQLNYVDLKDFFEQYKYPVLGAFMDGNSIYSTFLPQNAALLMGNEANGISDELLPYITQKISIPLLSEIQQTESLNVAMAMGIILGEMASQKLRNQL